MIASTTSREHPASRDVSLRARMMTKGGRMPLADYGVLTGQVLDRVSEGGSDSPHFQILVQGGDEQFRLAVNVLSQESPSELLFLADESFAHPIVESLPTLPDGFTPIVSQPGGIALDFIRGNLFDRTAMRPLPPNASGPDNDLAEKLDHYIGRAVADLQARIYAFGQRWGPETAADKVFGFRPGNGVHDIHMNQGNSAAFRRDDGVWQDGGLLIHYPGADQWVAIFLAFQSQVWHTDDTTGHASTEIPEPGPGPLPSPGEPDQVVRIVGSLVNASGPAPEHEFVTLLNASPDDIDLAGWALCDRLKRQTVLDSVSLAAGRARRFPVELPMQLGNDRGLISLLNRDGLKVDGVAYTKDQASREGWTLVF
jgi:uncharacterized protein YukJ